MSAGRWLAILAARRAAASQGRGPRFDRLVAGAAAAPGLHGIGDAGPFELPPGARLLADVAYGGGPATAYDLYLPRGGPRAPIFVMVHGGGWSRGDKASWRSVRNKVGCWVERGYALASVNYRMLPEAGPLEQADDVARALAHLQATAASWGGDPARMLLVGHSSGAHLASLIAVDPTIGERVGASPCIGTIAIDTAAFDVDAIMRAPHLGLYDRAFGHDSSAWRMASPLHRLGASPTAPMLCVCSSRRADSCQQAQTFADAARRAGSRVEVLALDLSHVELNDLLGTRGDYTDAVGAFIRSIGLP